MEIFQKTRDLKTSLTKKRFKRFLPVLLQAFATNLSAPPYIQSAQDWMVQIRGPILSGARLSNRASALLPGKNSGVVMQSNQLMVGFRTFGILAAALVAGCAQMQVGGGKNPVRGSAADSASTGAASKLQHCPRPLGTLAVEENVDDPWYAILTKQYKLPPTVPLIRLMAQQSNCFVVADRSRAMNSMMSERGLAASGEPRGSSNLGRRQIVAADYIVTPSIQFSAQTGGALGAVSAIGGS